MKKYKFILLVGLLGLTACASPNNQNLNVAEPTATTEEVIASPTPLPPHVAVVNGELILENSFNISLAQFESAAAEYGTLLASDKTAQQQVLDSLIERELLRQGAREAGYMADGAVVAERLNRLVDQVGGQENFDAWLVGNGYNIESFTTELTLEIEATWMRNEIAKTIPDLMEQIEARQLFFYDAATAQQAYGELVNGTTSFDWLALYYGEDTRGYLGWFPRGYLLFPQIEEAVFALQPGEVTAIIETEIGFHIVEVLDRAERNLSQDARLTLQEQALRTWLIARTEASSIEVYIP